MAIMTTEIVTPTAMPTVFPWPDDELCPDVLLFDVDDAACIGTKFGEEFS